MCKLSVVIVAVLAACGGGSEGPVDGEMADAALVDAAFSDTMLETDAGPDPADAATDAPVALVIAPAARPVLTPCPVGWRVVPAPTPDDVDECSPWPASGRIASCPIGEVHFPGEAGCAPVGRACPVGIWPEGIPTGAPVIFANPTGTGAQLGTMAAPFRTLADAYAAMVTPGTTIALAKGTFNESLVVTSNVTILGACSAETTIAGPLLPVLDIRTAVATVRNLRITGVGGGIQVAPGAWMVASGLLIEATRGPALLVQGAATISDLHVRDIEPGGAPGNESGVGLQASQGIQSIDRAVFERTAAQGWRLDGSAMVNGSRIAILDTLGASNGIGVQIAGNSQLVLLAATIERTATTGLYQYGGKLTLRAVNVTDVRPDSFGAGAGAFMGGGELTAEKMLLARIPAVGLLSREGSAAGLTDVVIRDVRSTVLAAGLQTRGQVRAERVLVSRVHGYGLSVQRGALALTDATVLDAGGDLGHGLVAFDGGVLTGNRIQVSRTRLSGVLGAGGAQVWLRELEVTGTDFPGCGGTTCTSQNNAIGVAAITGSTVQLTRFRLVGNKLCGALLATGGQLDLFRGELIGNPIGLSLGPNPYDLARVTDNVLYINSVNLDGTVLPLPPDPGLPP